MNAEMKITIVQTKIPDHEITRTVGCLAFYPDLALAVLKQVLRLKVLSVGLGATGQLMGCQGND